MKKRALISVFYKKKLLELTEFLVERDYEIVSTGGTYQYLLEKGIPVTEVSEITGVKEMLDGRVKSMHPWIHAGILAKRDKEEHMKSLEMLGIAPIDLVVCNLYPFFEQVKKEDLTFEEKLEFIDIGGPSMLRAAAKSFQDVVVLCEPNDYALFLEEVKEKGEVSYKTRRLFASKVFNLMTAYDASIAEFLLEEDFPRYLSLAYEKKEELRYGENPHQKAAYYVSCLGEGAMKDYIQRNGKELSFNNLRDMDVAWKVVSEFEEELACCALKHSTPCGVALGETALAAYKAAYSCDPISIFGGIVAFNSMVDSEVAEEMRDLFLEIIIAPSYTEKALEILKEKKNLRIIECQRKPSDPWNLVKVDGGILLQEEDQGLALDYTCVTDAKPSEKNIKDLLFAWKVVKHVKSNAIVVAREGKAMGVGTGEVNRIWAAEQALERAGTGLVLASDAFFPFRDVVDTAAKYGIEAIIQPGGSLRDEESIAACNEHGIAMLLTGERHFKH